ncbi:hypothetical protein DL766_008002 [Monosporascus sp. MC13-8B]|nr:hypothetical protein DL766_008002 [Monosporascus sp. MC13-8B]
MARAVLDDEPDDEAVMPSSGAVCSGLIGANKVVINLPLQLAQASDIQAMVQDLPKPFGRLGILITGFGSALISDAVKEGDVVISRRDIGHGGAQNANLQHNPLLQAADVLQREVGADGRWLLSDFTARVSASTNTSNIMQERAHSLDDNPQLHYRNTSTNIRSGGEMRISGIATDVGTDFEDLPANSMIVLGVNDDKGLLEDNVSNRHDRENHVIARVILYAQELIKLSTMQYLMETKSGIQGTETIVPPFMDPAIPPFESHRYPLSGKGVLLVIPTANKQKEAIWRGAFGDKAPNGTDLHIITAPFDSCVGEQPYNEAGSLGAHNRITNALRALHAANHQEMLRLRGIGTIIVACIESYIQTDHVPRPTDYGIVMIHNATADKTMACVSWGTTVDPAYVDRARGFGFDRDPNFGRVTVGQVLAAHIPGLDKADWHVVLGGRSRYELLKEAIAQLEIPWDWRGDQYCRRVLNIDLVEFEGTREVKTLEAFPIELSDDKEQIKSRLVKRGQDFESLIHQPYKAKVTETSQNSSAIENSPFSEGMENLISSFVRARPENEQGLWTPNQIEHIALTT